MTHPKLRISPPSVPAVAVQQGPAEFPASSAPYAELAYSPILALAIPASDRILLQPEVLDMVRIGRTTLYKMVKAGTFPAPLHLTERIRGWKLSAVQQFLASVEGE